MVSIEYIHGDMFTKPQVCIHCDNTINFIDTEEVRTILPEQYRLYKLIGLSDEQIRTIVKFLRS